MKKIVTRFAPSPTGYVHIGGLRTALFSFLWARKNGGHFRIRIEDTDQKREVPGAAKKMVETLSNLGLAHDGEILTQSHREAEGIYRTAAERLLTQGNAYYCFCSAETLDAMRKEQSARKKPPGYDGRCRELDPAESAQRIQKGEAAVIRIKMKPEAAEFHDELHGTVRFHHGFNDAVLLKSDGYPTYHLASVIDDHAMNITHVIRGEEWLPSAPLHAQLYEYFGYTMPKFYHIPLILNQDKTKLSKRQNDVSVESYLEKGYLKEALINYIAFLGWNPGGKREIYSLDELIRDFDLSALNTSAAIFSIDKLNWYNGWYIKNLLATKPKGEIMASIRPFLGQHDDKKSLMLFELFYERINSLSELTDLARAIVSPPAYESALLIYKKSTREKTVAGLQAALQMSHDFKNEWTHINLEIALKEAAAAHSLLPGDVFWPVRVALSGQPSSPPPTELMGLLGRDQSVERIKMALKKT